MTDNETSRANLPVEGAVEKHLEDPPPCPSLSHPVLSEETSGRKPFATADLFSFLKYSDPEKGSIASDITIYVGLVQEMCTGFVTTISCFT
jgi:hypothetical protein